MRKEFVLILLLIAFAAAPLPAQDGPTGHEIGVFASWHDWQPHTLRIGPPQTSTPFDLGFSYNDRASYGVRANFLSHGHWAGELSYSYQKNTATLTRASFTPVTLSGGVHHAFYNQVFYPFRYGGAFVPFITGGVGLASFQLSDNARARAADPRVYGLGDLKSTDNRVALNYGGGVKLNFSEGFGIRVDFRHLFSDVPSYGLPKQSTDPSRLVFPAEGKLQTYEASFGVYFRKLSGGFR